MKWSKNKKIIFLTSGIGILTTSIAVPIVLLNSNQDNNKSIQNKEVLEENQIEKDISASAIKLKIKNKDLIISKNIKTFSDDEILLAIKNQLKINNPSLTNNDLSKILDNIWHLKPGKKTSVILTIKSQGLIDSIKVNVTKEKNIKLWTKNSAIVKNSNIRFGRNSSFIQDSSGNLWAAGNSSKLRVLKRDGIQWEEDITTGLTKGSNIIGRIGVVGRNTVIFEDDFGNIWSMGKYKKLQVLVKNEDGTFANSWTDKNKENGEKLLQGSKINNGHEGSIFQDSFGNLWAMANGSKLQVLVKNKDGNYATSWDSNNSNSSQGLLKNSNISNGKDGRIFQDSFGNLWSMGYTNYKIRTTSASDYSLLQVLKADSNSPTGYVKSGWTYHWGREPLLKNSEIIRGQEGVIFQDSFKNLWASGGVTKLQVLEANKNGDGYIKTGWTNDNTKGLLKNSKIFPSKGFAHPVEVIFQDSFGNLWMSGYDKKPQVLKVNSQKDGYVNEGWTNDNTKEGLLKNLKWFSSSFGIFFQDSFKNLWAMGNDSKLQVLKAKPDGTGYVNAWANDNSENGDELLRFSYINDGARGIIFEDSSKNLWATGGKKNSKLQVYDKILKRWIS